MWSSQHSLLMPLMFWAELVIRGTEADNSALCGSQSWRGGETSHTEAVTSHKWSCDWQCQEDGLRGWDKYTSSREPGRQTSMSLKAKPRRQGSLGWLGEWQMPFQEKEAGPWRALKTSRLGLQTWAAREGKIRLEVTRPDHYQASSQGEMAQVTSWGKAHSGCSTDEDEE